MERDYLLEFLLYVGTPNFPISLVKYFSSLPKALFLTLEVTIGATIIALLVGLLLALMRVSKSIYLSYPAGILIYIGRCVPLPPLQLLVYLGITTYILMEPKYAGVIAIGLFTIPYMAELFRSGIQDVSIGMKEAGTSLGMSKWILAKRVIIPVAVRTMLPAIGQLMVGTMINSAFVSQIGAKDITGMARNIINAFFSTELWIVVAVTYFLIAFPLSRALNWLERRIAIVQ
jgi:His/Glu/Gln/Arg/opine family amino acid ABC transporter permease subunit